MDLIKIPKLCLPTRNLCRKYNVSLENATQWCLKFLIQYSLQDSFDCLANKWICWSNIHWLAKMLNLLGNIIEVNIAEWLLQLTHRLLQRIAPNDSLMVHFYADRLWRRLMNLWNESKNKINKQIIGVTDVVTRAIKACCLMASN